MSMLKRGMLVWVVAGGRKFRGELVAVGRIIAEPKREAERAEAFAAAAKMPASIRDSMIANIENELRPVEAREDDGVTADVNYYVAGVGGTAMLVGGVPEAKLVDAPADESKLVDGTFWPRGEVRSKDGAHWIPEEG